MAIYDRDLVPGENGVSKGAQYANNFNMIQIDEQIERNVCPKV